MAVAITFRKEGPALDAHRVTPPRSVALHNTAHHAEAAHEAALDVHAAK